MRYGVADIESNGLLDTISVVHSLVIRDLESDEVVSCADQPGYTPIAEGLKLLQTLERVYFHNGIRYDYPALRIVYPHWDMDRSKIRDTLTIVQMRWAHVKDMDYDLVRKGRLPAKFVGLHSLKAWGFRIGVLKQEFEDAGWEKWTPLMQTYCEGDTLVGKALVEYIRQHPPSAESMDIEFKLAWYLQQQELNGWPFDIEKAIKLQSVLVARREELAEQLTLAFPPWKVSEGTRVAKRKTKTPDGKVHLKGETYTKYKTITFNPGSRQHIANRLTTLFGWKPETFTASGQPEMNDDVMDGLDASIPEIKLLSEFLLVDKRLGQLAEGKQAWLKKFKVDEPQGSRLTHVPHMHGRMKQNGTITHRAAHVDPNMGQVPKVGSPYGAECRALFGVPDGWFQVGADMSGLEARCLAHYMARYDDGAYGRLLLEGDVHDTNRVALGLPEGKMYRDGTKNWFYAFMYGAGDEKLGKMLAPLLGQYNLDQAALVKIGKARRAQFLKNVPALSALISSVKHESKKGYLITLDGRRVYTRSEHAALNTLLQCAGAIIAKKWIVNFDARLTDTLGPQGWQGKWAALGWIHDEVQIAARMEEYVGRVLVEEAAKLTEHFSFRVPIAATSKVGKNWKETH